MVISIVQKSLMQQFVLTNIDFNSITFPSRENSTLEYILLILQMHNSDYNSRVAVAYIDNTNWKKLFRVLRQSYYVHKEHHLIKPTLITAPDRFSHSILYSMDVILGYHNNYKIFWLISVIERISKGCTNVHMCKILRTKWKYFEIPYGSEKYVIVPLLHNENELF